MLLCLFFLLVCFVYSCVENVDRMYTHCLTLLTRIIYWRKRAEDRCSFTHFCTICTLICVCCLLFTLTIVIISGSTITHANFVRARSGCCCDVRLLLCNLCSIFFLFFVCSCLHSASSVHQIAWPLVVAILTLFLSLPLPERNGIYTYMMYN